MISEELKKFYKEKLKYEGKIIKVPILVDYDFFASCKTESNFLGDEYFLYAGSLKGSKDEYTYWCRKR